MTEHVRIRLAAATMWSSSKRTHPKFCETVSNFSNRLDGCPLEEPVWTKHLDEKPGAYDFDRPFKAQLVARRCLIIPPVYAVPKASSGDRHESHLERLSVFPN